MFGNRLARSAISLDECSLPLSGQRKRRVDKTIHDRGNRLLTCFAATRYNSRHTEE